MADLTPSGSSAAPTPAPQRCPFRGVQVGFGKSAEDFAAKAGARCELENGHDGPHQFTIPFAASRPSEPAPRPDHTHSWRWNDATEHYDCRHCSATVEEIPESSPSPEERPAPAPFTDEEREQLRAHLDSTWSDHVGTFVPSRIAALLDRLDAAEQRADEAERRLAVEQAERIALETALAEKIGEMNFRDGKYRPTAYSFRTGDTRRLSPRQRAIFGLRPDPELSAILDAALAASPETQP